MQALHIWLPRATEEAEKERQAASLQYRLRLQMYYDDLRRQQKLSREAREHKDWLLFLAWSLNLALREERWTRSLATHFTSACTVEEAA